MDHDIDDELIDEDNMHEEKGIYDKEERRGAATKDESAFSSWVCLFEFDY
jgi:hypothetical protein